MLLKICLRPFAWVPSALALLSATAAKAQDISADPAGSGVIVSAMHWLQGTLLGTVATVVAVIAVATVGLLMLTGRIILGELRGEEAYTFLRAINAGHPGSMTSVHADSADRAIEQIVLLVLQAGTQLSRDDVRHYVKNTVDVFVQIARHGGQRRVAEVLLA